MEEKHIVTIDLGTDKLGVSVATVDANNKVAVSYYNEFASEGIKHSRVSNPTNLKAKLKEALSKVESAMQIKISEVMVNVQRYGIREMECIVNGSTSTGDNVSEADLELLDSLVWENREGVQMDEEIVACAPQSYDLDAGEINVSPDEVVGMCSASIRGKYKVYVLKQSAYNVIDNAFKDCGVINVRKVFVPDAIGRGILSNNEIQGGVALIDLGAGASSVSIFSGGVLKHYGAIPFGGINITYDIANVCCISERLAENIKMAYGGCMPDRLGSLGDKKLRITDNLDGSRKELAVKYLSEIITSRQREIIEALLYEIQNSGYADKLKNGVVVTGGGASMLNICQFIKELSGYSTKVGATSRDRFTSEDSRFFSLGASMSCGLLRKYSSIETSGCEPMPAAAAEPEVQQPEAEQEESGSLFKSEQITVEPKAGVKGVKNLIGGWFKGNAASKESEDEAPEQQQKPMEKTKKKSNKKSEGGIMDILLDFGDDEEV